MMATDLWLWLTYEGHISCGSDRCRPAQAGPSHVLNPVELAELAALARAQRTTLRCRCGAVEYDPASRTVREANDPEKRDS